MKTEIRKIEFEVEIEEREENDKPQLSGYAIKWGALSQRMWGFQEKFEKGAFSRSLKEQKVLMFWNHNRNVLLGNTESKTLRLEEDEKGLRFEVDLPDTQAAKDVRALIKRKDVKGMSFGFYPRKQEWDETDPKRIIRTIKEADLFEVSPTHSPAYLQTKVTARDENGEDKAYEEYKKRQAERSSKMRENLLRNKGVM